MVLESRTRIGALGEHWVTDALEQEGHRILARNWRWHRHEIDVISMHRDTLMFHEVKCRSGCATAIDRWDVAQWRPSHRQQRRIVQAGHAFVRQHKGLPGLVRFDLWLVVVTRGAAPTVRRFPDAFDGASAPCAQHPWSSRSRGPSPSTYL